MYRVGCRVFRTRDAGRVRIQMTGFFADLATRVDLNTRHPIRDTSTMLLRTVRMTFRPDQVEEFLEGIFYPSAPRIREFPGCRHLELWRDARYPNILTTFSRWDDAEALERYREGELFRSTWARTTPMFAAPPVAHSQTVETEAGG